MASTGNPDHALEREAQEGLLELLGAGGEFWLRESQSEAIDFVVEREGLKIVVELKRSSEVPAIQGAIDQLKHYCAEHPDCVPVVATLFMGPGGRRLCAEQGVGWFDLSGNADVTAPGLRLLIDGKPNKFKRPGRPSSIFAPKASRLARVLLMQGNGGRTQQQLIESTQLEKGYVSRVLKRMREKGLIHLRGAEYFVPRRDTLLDAWRAQYDFSKHRIVKGAMAVRSGEDGIRRIASVLPQESYAATGLAGAWFCDSFAMFRTATVYLREELSKETLEELSFIPTERGSNTWLVWPNDEGVFEGQTEIDGISCAHPLQIYLDLQAHPERAPEAAEHLRQSHLNWSNDDR